MKIFSLVLFITLCVSCASRPTYQHSLDAHMHIEPSKESEDLKCNGERALYAANSVGIEKAIVISSAYSKMAYKDFARSQNYYVASEARKNRKKLAGACGINPSMDWAREELNRCHHDGLGVLKINTVVSGIDLRSSENMRQLKEVLKRAEDLKFTLLINTNLSHNGESEALLKALESFPKMRIILGHAFAKELRLLDKFNHPNFLVETSLPPHWSKSENEQKQLVKLMRKIEIKNFIFGSDWPVMHPAETLNELRKLPLTDQEIERITYTNAMVLDDLFK